MRCCEECREKDGRRPKANSFCQRELHVTAEQKLLRKSDSKKKERPRQTPSQKPCPMNRQRTEAIAPEHRNQAHHCAKFRQSQQRALPEQLPESVSHGKTVCAK